MIPTGIFDGLPLAQVYLLYVACGLLATEVGFQIGRLISRRSLDHKDGNVGAIVGSTLALLAFLLAFFTGVATTRFGERRELVITEANAIGTAYLRAGYLPEPQRAESRALYREYVDLRLAALDPAKFLDSVQRSEEVHRELWVRGEALSVEASNSPVLAIYLEALNEVIDVHGERLAVARARLPVPIWQAIYLMSFLSLSLVGYQNGLNGNRSLIATTVLVLMFTAVLELITDLDRPQAGLLQVSQQALIDLQRQLWGGP